MNGDAAVVAGVDGSEPSNRALVWAAEEAALRQTPLRIVYVTKLPTWAAGPPGRTPGELQERMTDLLTDAGRQLLANAQDTLRDSHPELQTATKMVWADTVEGLIGECPDATMLVVGSRGVGGFRGMVLGSTSLRTAMRAHRPVAVIPGYPADETAGRAGDRVVVGVDGSANAAAAVMLAFEEAALHQVGVTAVHVAAAPPPELVLSDTWAQDTGAVADADRLLGDATTAARERYPGVDVDQVAVIGHPAAMLVEQCAGARMVVVGCRGRGGFAGLLLGSVSQGLMHHAGCPVLITRDPRSLGQ